MAADEMAVDGEMAAAVPDTLADCLEYFQARPVYQKVFEKIREKAISLGHFGGTAVFTSLSREEKEALEGFFQKSFRNQKTVTISAALMQRALDDSRFASLNWEEILEAYFGEALTGKREQERQKEEERNRFFSHIAGDSRGTGRDWLEQTIQAGGLGFRLLMGQYRDNKEQLERLLPMVLSAANQLPSYEERCEALPVFAARITGNPHFFDANTTAGRLLEAFLIEHYGCRQEPGYTGAEWKNHVLYQAGILKDDLSNYTMAYGIGAARKDGSTHEGIEGFWQVKEPVQCTLLTLGGMEDAWGNPAVYVVENPAVFSELMRRNPEASLVCTNGQPRLASLVLLDFLSRHSILWYAGDFDPEGLVIAQNLKRRYGKRLRYWDYRVEYYRRGISEVALSDKRLHMLDRVVDAELRELVDEIRKTRRAAYQEAMLGWAYGL